jgi:hypothetical protein
MPENNFPLTLAEVLFEELETMCADIDESQTEIQLVYAEDESRGLAFIRAVINGTEWDGVEERVDEIRTLPTSSRKEIGEICKRDGIRFDDSGEDLGDLVLRCKKELSERLVPVLYEIIRKLPQTRSALCLSGGGVRSAVFNLGILQGLARCGLLDKFDYLSTVSGGGFIGSWLTAWIHREEAQPGKLPVNKVAARLADPPSDPFKPEPPQLFKLRVYANYLTPRKGLLGVDTWTLVAVYLRNLFLNWLVFVPVIMALLMLPRIWFAFVQSPYLSGPFVFHFNEPVLSYLSPRFFVIAGFATAAFALIYIAMNLPGSNRWNFRERSFVAFGLAPLVISAMALTTYWARLQKGEEPTRWQFIIFAVALAAAQWVPYVGLRMWARRHDKRENDGESFNRPGAWQLTLKLAAATGLIVVAFAITGFVIWYLVVNYVPPPLNLHLGGGRLYASLAVPLLLILLTIGGTLISGFTSRFTEVDDQEWWARSGAWILILAICWSVCHVLVLFGPTLFVDLQNLLVQKSWTWASIKGVSTAVVGIVSGAITIFGGKSAKTPVHGEEKQTGGKPKLQPILMSLAAVIFAGFIIVVLALVTNWILASSFGAWAGEFLRAGVVSLNANDPRAIIYHSPGRLLAASAALLAVAGWIFGRVINTNRFSLHYYWRNRMMRAYLGVSRHTEERDITRNKFTDFDLKDNVQMYELKQKPLHVVNVTLNLAGGKKLEWQDRKAESFSISPLHSGSYWLGYRNSRYYGGNDGISLATAVAISGAAASPNMGYMMTSPVIRFIMALFNVRLGFWLGNPGVAGSGDPSTFNQPTYDRDSPTQSVRPIFAEALGMTNDKSPYVYLSDGGHFDNFGLYEMILRRCRFIVISDASTDPDYRFESLAYAIRQIRVDFGVPIEMRGEMYFDKEPKPTNRYCAIGDIRYSCVDKPGGGTPDPAYDGVLIYIKPSLNCSEPADVLNYHETDDAFPQDTIADQWFSEPQFESYRALGSHMVETIYNERSEGGGNPEVESVIAAAIKTLGASDPAFGKFAEGAWNHVGCYRDSASKDS